MTNITKFDIPVEWTERLKTLQNYFPDVVIAGGSLRDLWHGKTPKDVDFFVPLHVDNDILGYDAFYESEMAGKLNVVTSTYGTFSTPELTSVYRYDKDFQSDVIFIDLPKSKVLERFDFGLCQIAFDGEEVFYTDNFIKDVENKTITLLRSDNQDQFDRSMRRCDRLTSEKYDGYEVILGEFSKYEI